MAKKTFISPAIPVNIVQPVIDRAEEQGCELHSMHIVPLNQSKITGQVSMGAVLLFTKQWNPATEEKPTSISIDINDGGSPDAV